MKFSRTTLFRIIEALFIAAVFAVLIVSVLNVRSSSALSGKERLEESVRMAVLECYCSEGIYPPDVKYLEDNYGIQIDSSSYAVKYRIFSENVMPDIDIIELKK